MPSADATHSIREALNRKSLASARHRNAVGRLLRLSDNEVLALMHLGRAGALTPSTLGRLLALTSGGTTALVQRLERDGHITREAHPDDGRSTLLRISESTQRRAAEAMAPLVDDLDARVATLSDRERATIDAFLADVARLTEEHAERASHAAEAGDRVLVGEPVPGMWA
jgi:DNA-binding MarR family transcriptional regulator